MAESGDLVIRGATWVESGVPGYTADAVIESGRIVALGPGAADGVVGARVTASGARVVEARGMVLAPGFIDLHTHLREPGQEHKETIASGAVAAAAGGFTHLVAMANTTPAVDDLETLTYVMRLSRQATVRVHTAAAVTEDLAGRELTHFPLLASCGAVAFTDDGRNAYGAEVARRALAEARAVNRVLMVHAQDEGCCGDGQADPEVASRHGLTPWPASAETAAVEVVLQAARETGGRVHVQHVSCAATVEMLRAARAEGVPVTAEATPHHMLLTDARVERDGVPDPLAKVNPPLRPESDRAAVVAAVRDGVIDAVATDHAPHEAASKEVDFARASFGFSGLETALSACLLLVERGELTLERVVHCLTMGPRRCLAPALDSIPARLRPGDGADLVLFDPRARWTVEPERLLSRGRNTPLAGVELPGRVMLTVAGGRVVHDALDAVGEASLAAR